MSRPDEGLIHTWLDGELDAAEAARVEALVKSDPEWAAAAAEARGLIAASARIVGALDDVPANVVPDSKPAAGRPVAVAPFDRPVRRTMPSWLRAAAAVVVVAGTAVVLNRSESTSLVDDSEDARTVQVTAADSVTPPAAAAPEKAAPRDTPADAKRSNALADAAGKTAAQERSAAAPPQGAQMQQQAPRQVQSQVRSQVQSQLQSQLQAQLQSDSLASLKKEDERTKTAPAAQPARAAATLGATARDAGTTGNRVLPETKAILSEVVTTGSVDSRRAFAAAEAVRTGIQVCYREPSTGDTPGLVHRVVRASDTTAVAPLPLALGSTAPQPQATSGAAGAAVANARVDRARRDASLTRTTYRLKGDTLFVPLATGETRVAIKTPCP